jgi:hypothetical protein
MTTFLAPTRERFLLAIAAELPAERFIELHFFQPIRQGGIESGVAVIAAYPESQPEIVVADAPPAEQDRAEEREAELSAPLNDNEVDAPRGREPRRYTVYSARYKLVLKGPDRGKWESTVVAEADAPLVTVESVVRGVQRRSGDAEEPERMSGDEARDYVLAATR